jgi:hypothetical protein
MKIILKGIAHSHGAEGGHDTVDLRRGLADGSELIWSTVSAYVHRWRPDKAILIDHYEDRTLAHIREDFVTHVHLYRAENGSVVQKRFEENRDGSMRIEYWVHKPRSQDAIWDLLRRDMKGTLDGFGMELLDDYGRTLELA